jgi:hypothetical protein
VFGEGESTILVVSGRNPTVWFGHAYRGTQGGGEVGRGEGQDINWFQYTPRKSKGEKFASGPSTIQKTKQCHQETMMSTGSG